MNKIYFQLKKKFKNNFSSKLEYEFWVRNFKHWKYKGGNTYDLQTIYLIRKESMMNIVPNINLVTLHNHIVSFISLPFIVSKK